MKTRREFIEADYVNGVYDSAGNLVIRPMTPEETQWLSQFYAETEHGNFQKTQEIEAQEELIKSLRKKLKKERKGMTSEMVLELKQQIEEAQKLLVHLRAETNTFYPEEEDRYEIYRRGYERKLDVYNVAKSTNRMKNLDMREFDQLSSEVVQDAEKVVRDCIVRGQARKVIRKPRKRTE